MFGLILSSTVLFIILLSFFNQFIGANTYESVGGGSSIPGLAGAIQDFSFILALISFILFFALLVCAIKSRKIVELQKIKTAKNDVPDITRVYVAAGYCMQVLSWLVPPFSLIFLLSPLFLWRIKYGDKYIDYHSKQAFIYNLFNISLFIICTLLAGFLPKLISDKSGYLLLHGPIFFIATYICLSLTYFVIGIINSCSGEKEASYYRKNSGTIFARKNKLQTPKLYNYYLCGVVYSFCSTCSRCYVSVIS